MRYSHHDSHPPRPTHRAALFLDYDNLHVFISGLLGHPSAACEVVMELATALKRYLHDNHQALPAVTSAYADFGALEEEGGTVQRCLALQGVEPRFVPRDLQENAVELQLCIDATELLHSRPDVDTFVLVTGDRLYLPLLQQLRRYGRDVCLVAFDQALPSEDVQGLEAGLFAEATTFLCEASRRKLAREADPAPGHHEGAPPRHHRQVVDPVGLRTLEIIEEHFGQYEEVYLTPLLRKLSELLDERHYDPKTLISDLEDAGAVRLEKRRGYPYDYTVLIVEAHHPDVLAAHRAVYGRSVDDQTFDVAYDDDDEGYEYDEAELYLDEDDDDYAVPVQVAPNGKAMTDDHADGQLR